MLLGNESDAETISTEMLEDICNSSKYHPSINRKEARYKTCSRTRFPLRSHSLVCIKNHLFIVGIGTIINKELEFILRSDLSDCACVYR